MLVWYAVYSDEPQIATHNQEQAQRAAVLARFDGAAKLGIRDGRAVMGMWLIDDGTEQADVVRCYGAVPLEIKVRHEAYIARMTATN